MTTISNTQLEARSLAAFVERHSLSVFFVLAFALTWPVEILDALGSHGVIPFRASIALQLLCVAYMPTVAALIVTAWTSGSVGVRELLQKLLIWRVGVGWYVIALAGFALVCLSTVLLYNGLRNDAPLPLLARDAASAAGMELVLMVPALLLISALINGEELAWRGFALPRLQARSSALTSSIILGVIWAVWHLPLFFTRGSSQADMSFVSFMFQTIGLSVIFTWLFNNTRGSVLLAYLLHASINTWTRIFPIDHAPAMVGALISGIICLTAVGILVAFGSEHLRRDGQRIQHPDLRRTP